MYCENCGHKLGENHLFCEECGSKVNRVITNNVTNDKNSNKTLWIILGCVFGGLFLLIVLGIIFFSFLVVGVNSVDVSDEYEIEDYYDYEEVNEPYYYKDDSISVEKF